MKRPFYFLALLNVLFAHAAYAQTSATITVKAGTTVKESVPARDLYLYPQFTEGKVFFKNGKWASGNMNYNRFLDEIQFAAPEGDTLSLANEEAITLVTIGADTFFYDGGYVKLESHSPTVKIGTKQLLLVIDKEKIGAYGMSSPTTAIDTYNSFYDGRKNYDLVIMHDLLLARKRHYYIGTPDNHFAIATRKNVLELFPAHEIAIKNYLKTNTLAFENEVALEKLAQFIARL